MPLVPVRAHVSIDHLLPGDYAELPEEQAHAYARAGLVELVAADDSGEAELDGEVDESPTQDPAPATSFAPAGSLGDTSD